MFIDELDLPSALKKLTGPELEKAAGEIRSVIIDSVSKNGGHLASSLGAVELAIAIHTVFDSPKDKVVWDVGHQAYAHKILTGRLKDFGSLRSYAGISGFPSREESPHDPFTTGHASTAISSAIGLAKARDLKKEAHKVVAVIGDGSLSGGLSLEAINNAMNLNSNLVVVLNDNDMSISKNVGALSEYFTKTRMNPLYTKTKERVEDMVKKIPKFGIPLYKLANRLKERLKHFIVDFKTEVIVEELGFNYLGPIDGHNITLLMSALSFAKELKKPIMVHVLTKKGKGYSFAEKDPTAFHGVPGFDIATGKVSRSSGSRSYTQVFGDAMLCLGKENSKIVAVTAAMLDGTGLEDFSREFPDRFFDVGIAEEHSVIFAAGLAKGGLRPVCAIYSTFLQRSYDQLFHDVCLQDLPVVFCLDRAGIVGDDGPTHNGVFDMAYLRHLPNMSVMAPMDGAELEKMLRFAVLHNGPISIRYPRAAADNRENIDGTEIKTGKGEVVYRTKYPISNSQCPIDKKILIVAIGSMVQPSIEAAKQLEGGDHSVSVINARFVKPLDSSLILEEAHKADLVVTVEEGCLMGGFGSAVMELFEEHGVIKPLKRIGFPDRFIEAGKRDFILERCGLNASGIAKTISIFSKVKP
ncbi:MAG: 1-deoxy-D-xylulose-5-phosphate synthase [Candidatus Margulisiibacteriota bacterium]